MSLVPTSAANIQLIMQNDTQHMRSTISWLRERNLSYAQQMTTANMNTAGIPGGDQTAILAFIADIARLVTFVDGTNPGVFANIGIDITNLLGVM